MTRDTAGALSASSSFSLSASFREASREHGNNQLRAVAAYMKSHSLVLTTAESCTAGLIAAHLADVPGAGSLLECAYVVYSPQAKQRCVGVSAETMARCNLTSEEVATEMARGALNKSPANVAIANTGVTDDTDPDIPAGTQCFAWLFAGREGKGDKLFTETRQFKGDRNTIREQAAVYALTQVPGKHEAFLQETTASRKNQSV
ncbi:CinA family protein [Polaromonas sp.]|uniref:CinA family protein n=1 Tax=Polaromonas sp. TaxID=1869339 RepID=UPI0032657E61